MINLVIDTDIGNDCDDAGALAIAHNLANQSMCDILAFTSNTSRRDGAQAIQIINHHYHRTVPVGMTNRTSFLAEEHGYGAYSRGLVSAYGHYLNGQPIEDAVTLLRRTLVASPTKVRIVCIGPLNNIADLMRSEACLESHLNGRELIKEKVESFVIMSGEFQKNRTFVVDGHPMTAEWNIIQDLSSARYVISHLDIPAVFIPYSVGLIETGQSLFDTPNYDSPIKLSYQIHSNGPRYSWDPITIYYAVMGESELFNISAPGIVSIDQQGITSFTEDSSGKHRYVRHLNHKQTVIDILNGLML